MNLIIDFTYLVAAALFIFGLKMMSVVRTARRGNCLAAVGMFLAVAVTLFDRSILTFQWILIGIVIGSLAGAVMAMTIKMTAMPQMVGLLNGFGGLASALVACAELIKPSASVDLYSLTTIDLGTFVGAITFAGSVVAFGKLQGLVIQQPLVYSLQKTGNLLLFFACIALSLWHLTNPGFAFSYWLLFAVSLLLGILLVLPIGGADMPVVISLLNSYSGVAAAITGFVLMNKVLIVSGALVGAAGLILTQIMCRAMNRSLANVAFGAFGRVEEAAAGKKESGYANVKSCTAEEAAMILESAQSLVIVPGYGMAVGHAQHAVKELADLLEERGTTVKYAIHPVAGRMPGHMNVLLAEAEVPYDQLYEMEAINPEFEQTDVAFVIGANDVVNPAARNEPGSPIYGMPILDVFKARSCIVLKRTLSPGFAGIKNPLFEKEKTLMYFDDAKAGVEKLVKELKNL